MMQRHCDTHLDAAERLLGTPQQAASAWVSVFDAGALAVEKARCYQQLGRPVQVRAETATAIASRTPDRVRSRAFAQLTAVSAMIDEGSLDEACSTASEVVDTTRLLGSRLAHRQLEELLPRFAPYAGNRDVAEFLDHLRDRLSDRYRKPRDVN
ncbi:hypothetical protein ACFQO7_22940 [Catellatospora aurea]|uniref:Transcriptional regulator n=1 Tax=Catellatospora aurea TaxID=1337874 RepID=A0ABW2GZC8_9ACTN